MTNFAHHACTGTATSAGVSIHYTIEGDVGAPVLVMSNSLGTTLQMWAPQMPALLRHFRVLRYDTRGHGRSSVPMKPFGMAELGRDVLAVMDHAGVARAHFCGLSMGGMTGLWLARHHADRFGRFVLANTAALIGPASVWDNRIATVRRDGMAAIVPGVLERWFSPSYRASHAQGMEPVRDMLLACDPAGYTANCAAVRDADLRGLLSGVEAKVLVIAGEQDAATTPAQAREVARAVPQAEYLSLDAAHLSNWELPQAFGQAVVRFGAGG
ncbi:3-oxoadipate enol-lactonase [Cupriavidus neocaledonicus]|uniref:3-oxoadipate enol-lactonase 2 n=1 Tax=Cupriavidus neocaledonicus TaxID=1040979 RepID=A0A375H6W0_9BURK|nr:3-oxoadipate enol-lactonase [Cupriavidus neocaledonicus]SOZ34894.1 3-oxoadipate enol-lactonase 2 [Cupriavidus neocaledonicus]SPD46626.1 3-oxoadipate enol-lactonase 2 [Cupriavidus neocaledonicus]